MYKLVAIDMDGTLLKEDKTVSEKTKEAIKKARKSMYINSNIFAYFI